MIGSVFRIFRLGIRVFAWATPRVKEWHQERNLNRLEGQRHLESRNWSMAETHLALALKEKRHSAKAQIGLLLGLQKAQRRQGKLADAEKTARTAVEAAAAARNSSLHAESLDALAGIQLDQKNYSGVEATITEIECLEKGQMSPNLARLAKCSRNLGNVLLQSGRKDEAMKAFERAATLSEEAFGAEHIETANSFAEMGTIYRERGEHAEAQRCLRRALEIHRAALGADSHEATQDLFHLAASLEDSGNLTDAVGEYERLLAYKERQVGGNREHTAETQVRLARLYIQEGRTSAARELLMHAVGTLDRKGGAPMALALETFACLEDELGRTQDAQRWREKAMSIAAKSSASSETPATK